MEMDFTRKQEFLEFSQMLQEQKDSVSIKEQLSKLKDELGIETYDCLLFDCFLWKYRDFYLKLFGSFLNYEISGDEFATQFLTMRLNHINEFHELMKQLQLSKLEINVEFFNKFSLDLNAFGFTEILDPVEDDYCDSLVSDELEIGNSGENEEFVIDENQLRERIEKTFLLISKV